MIKDRFEGYGATVEVRETPMALKLDKVMNRKTDRQTYPQRIIEWLYAHEGYEFDINDMLHDIDLNQGKFHNVKRENPYIKQLLAQMRTGKGRYKVIFQTDRR